MIDDLGLDISSSSLKQQLSRMKASGLIDSYTEGNEYAKGSKSYYSLSYAALTLFGFTNDDYSSDSMKMVETDETEADRINSFLGSAKQNKPRTKEQIEEDNTAELRKSFRDDVIKLIKEWYSKRNRVTQITNAQFLAKILVT